MDKYFNKRMYSIKEFCRFLTDALKSLKHFIEVEEKNILGKGFVERIMLAVTQVNGCKLCAYVHTKEALKSGVSEDEIAKMLSGSIENVPKAESIAIFFAQHYAEQKGKPNKEAWERVVKIYGKKKAMGILAVTRVIMVGNVYGIAFGTLENRLNKKYIDNSNLAYELAIVFGVIIFLPLAAVKCLIEKIKGYPFIRFEKVS